MTANVDFDRDYIPEPEGGAIRGLLFAILIMAILAAFVCGVSIGVLYAIRVGVLG